MLQRRHRPGAHQRSGTVILDEPMPGLDPPAAATRALIRRLRDKGCTVFFSSHVLSDAEASAAAWRSGARPPGGVRVSQ
jgi:ABC-type sugar transport system ATPase subunit